MPGPSKTPRAGARVALRLGLVVATILVVLGVLEVVLRLRPTLLGDAYANGALSRYTVRAGGIYYRDRNLRMNFMIPNFMRRLRNAPLHIPDRKSTRLNSSHSQISYAVFCLKK